MNDYKRGMLELGYDLVAHICGTEEHALTISDVKEILRYTEIIYHKRLGNLDNDIDKTKVTHELHENLKWLDASDLKPCIVVSSVKCNHPGLCDGCEYENGRQW